MTDTTPAVRIVPVEPTDAMLVAGHDAGCEVGEVALDSPELRAIFRAMLAAAPVAPGEGEDDQEAVALLQARHALRDLHSKNSNCGYGKMAEACERAALRARSGPEAGAVDDEQIVNAMLRAAERAADREEPGFWQDRARTHIANVRKRSLDHPEVQAAIAEARQFLADCGAHPAPSDASATERMRAALVEVAREESPLDKTGEPLQVRIAKDLTRRIEIARAALGEA